MSMKSVSKKFPCTRIPQVHGMKFPNYLGASHTPEDAIELAQSLLVSSPMTAEIDVKIPVPHDQP